MRIKDRIIETLISIENEYKEVMRDSFIIGASAMILSGVDIDNTEDIDILTSHESSERLKKLLDDCMEVAPETKENDLFISNFSRYKLPLMDIEVMGNLKIMKNGLWIPVCVEEYIELSVGNLSVKVPSLTELRRILLLFGREKDLRRVDLLNQYIN